MIELPLNHYRHLRRLADLRRCSVGEAVQFLFRNVEPNSRNWIDKHFGESVEVRRVSVDGTAASIMERIQGLPRNIRPVTDGAYLEEFSFFREGDGLIGIDAAGVRILDFEGATDRDRSVFALVRDLLPPMAVEEYRVYNTFNSQYLRLVREPNLFTMPRVQGPAIDAGCYVGYKALALSQFIGGSDVLAFEIAGDNFDVLLKNAANNSALNVRPLRIALSDRREKMRINTRNARTMAHSLTPFDVLKEGNTALQDRPAEIADEQIDCHLLDDFTRDYDTISAIHISVNGHEPQVVIGATDSLRKSDIIRVSCPYKLGERPIFDMVVDLLHETGTEVFGRSGGAVVAGRQLGDYHAVPLTS